MRKKAWVIANMVIVALFGVYFLSLNFFEYSRTAKIVITAVAMVFILVRIVVLIKWLRNTKRNSSQDADGKTSDSPK